MKHFRRMATLAAAFLILFVLRAGASSPGTKIDFSSLDANHAHNLSGTLYLWVPENPSPQKMQF